MNIKFDNINKVFILENKNIIYSFYVNEVGVLVKLYFGEKIHDLTKNAINYMNDISGDVYSYYDLDNKKEHEFFNPYFSGQGSLIEIPSYLTYDKRKPLIVINHNDNSLITDFRYVSHEIFKGKTKFENMPYIKGNENECITLKITLKDLKDEIYLDAYYTIYEDLDLIVRHNEIINKSNKAIYINKASSLALDLNNDDYEAIITDEASLIDINKQLKKDNKEELYLFYPKDGVSINDMTLAYISSDKSKEKDFLGFQRFLLSEKGQELLQDNGYRTWYGGINNDVDAEVFNPDWGIDTSKYLNVTNFPSKKVITKAINVYIESLRKPTHAIFCLDYSGSMSGEGIEELRKAMNYILDSEESSKDRLQFSKNDKITVITFSSSVTNVWSSTGSDTSSLIENINNYKVGGSTALYDAIEKGLEVLKNESDDYTTTIIAMTDGYANEGSFNTLSKYYKKLNKEVPVYSITFGMASLKQLNNIAKLTNAKVFDGTENLLDAFKEVRSYN